MPTFESGPSRSTGSHIAGIALGFLCDGDMVRATTISADTMELSFSGNASLTFPAMGIEGGHPCLPRRLKITISCSDASIIATSCNFFVTSSSVTKLAIVPPPTTPEGTVLCALRRSRQVRFGTMPLPRPSIIWGVAT